MAREPRHSAQPEAPERVRLFLALDLPPEARSSLAGWRDATVRTTHGLRAVADEALHVTLVFLDRHPRRDVERIWETAERSLADLAAPQLEATGSRLVPPRRSRVLAVDLADDARRAAAVHEALAGALEGAGLHERERRAFWPHVTVARVRARARVRRVEADQPPAVSFAARMVTLYRSDLHPTGARYVALQRIELDAPGA